MIRIPAASFGAQTGRQTMGAAVDSIVIQARADRGPTQLAV